MSQENFYNFEELKDFTNNFTDLTIENFTKFLEVKTSNEHTIVSSAFIKDVNQLFLSHQLLIFKFVKLTNDIWDELNKENEKISKKYKEILTKFEVDR